MWDRKLYSLLTDDDGEVRSCEAIPEGACSDVPRNFVLNAANGSCTKLAEQLASPGLVLPWLLDAVGAPVFLVGWLEPIRQGGSLLPQLLVSAQIRARRVRKWFWVAAGTVQALLLALMAVAVAGMGGAAAGVAIVGLLALFSAASGVGSVAFADVLGKTVPKGKRGQLLAVRASAGGALTLAAGLVVRRVVGQEAGVAVYAALIGAAAVLWLVGAAFFAAIKETPGATAGARDAVAEIGRGVRAVRDERAFRRYLAVRGLLLATELQIPFLALHARSLGLPGDALGVLMIGLALADLLGSPVWGRLADRASSRMVMTAGAATSGLALVIALLLDVFGGPSGAWVVAPIFVLAGLAKAGVRLGRKTYLVDATRERDRALYVSTSNTGMGALAFAYGVLGFVPQLVGMTMLLLVLLGLSVLGLVASRLLPEAERAAFGRP